jgi:hypothetical protein
MAAATNAGKIGTWYPYGAAEWGMARRMRAAGLIRRAYGTSGGFEPTEAGIAELLPRTQRDGSA